MAPFRKVMSGLPPRERKPPFAWRANIAEQVWIIKHSSLTRSSSPRERSKQRPPSEERVCSNRRRDVLGGGVGGVGGTAQADLIRWPDELDSAAAACDGPAARAPVVCVATRHDRRKRAPITSARNSIGLVNKWPRAGGRHDRGGGGRCVFIVSTRAGGGCVVFINGIVSGRPPANAAARRQHAGGLLGMRPLFDCEAPAPIKERAADGGRSQANLQPSVC
jgi:hypothetical protein